jgi:site-specific recombinase XerD
MQSQISSYLYQYKNSANYFFRVRTSTLFCANFSDEFPQHFVASLRTSSLDDARWLAIYIRRDLVKFFRSLGSYDYRSESVNHNGAQSAISGLNVLDTGDFMFRLKARFSELLRMATLIIEHGHMKESNDFSAFTRSQTGSLEALSQAYSSEDMSAGVDKTITGIPKNAQSTTEPLNAQFLACIDMINTLASKLSLGHHREYSKAEKYGHTKFVTGAEKEGLLDSLVTHQYAKEELDKGRAASCEYESVDFDMKHQFEQFIAEKACEIDVKSVQKYRVAFTLLFSLYSAGCDLRAFTKADTQNVKAMLMKRSRNETQGTSDKLLSAKTKNGYLSNYRTFFSWVIKNTELDIKNPFAEVSFAKAKGKQKSAKRRSFSNEEVRAMLIYKSQRKNEAELFRNDAKWFVPISLYSGMRLNEMSALPLKHIKKIEDVWCFDLHGLDVKNESSERTIPIAQYLLELGLLEYIQNLSNSGEKLLFPEIRDGKSKPGSAGWGDPISRWFNRTLLKNIGINTEEEKALGRLVCFHCNRRTMISACVKGLAQHHLIKRIVGHSVEDDITLTVYSDIHEIPMKDLKALLDKHLTWHMNGESDVYLPLE